MTLCNLLSVVDDRSMTAPKGFRPTPQRRPLVPVPSNVRDVVDLHVPLSSCRVSGASRLPLREARVRRTNQRCADPSSPLSFPGTADFLG